MTIHEYKNTYPRDQVFIQVDDTERIMTPEEYEEWVIECVAYMNEHPTMP